jgi:hypothetical protein
MHLRLRRARSRRIELRFGYLFVLDVEERGLRAQHSLEQEQLDAVDKLATKHLFVEFIM